MKTEFELGEEVYIKAKVVGMTLLISGNVEYTVSADVDTKCNQIVNVDGKNLERRTQQ